MRKPYYPFIDYIRVSACFLVVLLHVSALKFYSFSPAWPVYVAFDALARMCVPLFFMISGFLLLDAPMRGIGAFYYSRFSRIFIPFAMLAFGFYFTPLNKTSPPLLYLAELLTRHLDYHLWYIYALTGIYLALPYFMILPRAPGGRRLLAIYAAIWFVAGICAPFVCALFGMANMFTAFNFQFFTGFMGYALCGWLLKQAHLPFRRGGRLLAASVFIAATCAIIAGTIWRSHSLGRPDELFFENLTPLVCLQAVSFFMLCSAIGKESKFIHDLSQKSFWIYLLHPYALRLGNRLVPLPQDLWALPAIPCYAIAIFLASYVLAIPMRRLEQTLLARLDALTGKQDKTATTRLP